MSRHADPDRLIVGALHTISTRSWVPLTGQQRQEVLRELAAAAAGRTDLIHEAAGVMLGLRPDDDEADPYHVKYTAAAGLLLELAGTAEDAPEVQRWVPVGAKRRDRWRRPEPQRGW